jgi:glutathione synthase
MDPLASIIPDRDTTLFLGVEAQARGHDVFAYTPDTLAYDRGAVIAHVHPVTLSMDPANHYTQGAAQRTDLKTFDVILLRQDPPFDMPYLTTTYLLERLHPRPLVVNNPASVRNLPEKLFPLQFAQFMPPTLISANEDDIRAFHRDIRDIVLKPLYGHGGRGVFRVGPDGANLGALFDLFFAHGREPLIAQQFLPDVAAQDRRIVLIDGTFAAVMGRVPAEGDIRANFRAGGSPAKAELTPRQRDICDAVGPVLKSHGLILAGLDAIGDYLTEINITSPTGLQQIHRLYGTRLDRMFWDAVESRF